MLSLSIWVCIPSHEVPLTLSPGWWTPHEVVPTPLDMGMYPYKGLMLLVCTCAYTLHAEVAHAHPLYAYGYSRAYIKSMKALITSFIYTKTT